MQQKVLQGARQMSANYKNVARHRRAITGSAYSGAVTRSTIRRSVPAFTRTLPVEKKSRRKSKKEHTHTHRPTFFSHENQILRHFLRLFLLVVGFVRHGGVLVQCQTLAARQFKSAFCRLDRIPPSSSAVAVAEAAALRCASVSESTSERQTRLAAPRRFGRRARRRAAR